MLPNNVYNMGRRGVCLRNVKFYKHMFYLCATRTYNVIVS